MRRALLPLLFCIAVVACAAPAPASPPLATGTSGAPATATAPRSTSAAPSRSSPPSASALASARPQAGATPAATQALPTATPAQLAYAHRCPGTAASGTGTLSEWTSTNWAGYLATRRGSRVTCVEASWIEPAVTCPSKGDSDVAIWVGVDGATWPSEGIRSAGTLIQAGTEIHCSAGTARHVAWHEIYPRQPEQQWDMAIQPGDRIWTMVSYSGGRFRLLVANLTTGAAEHVDETVSGAHRQTVEWVIETPAFGCPTSCRNMPLARFPAFKFSGARATIGGRLDGVVGPWDRARVTLQTGSTTLASVGPVASNGQSFTISWRHR